MPGTHALRAPANAREAPAPRRRGLASILRHTFAGRTLTGGVILKAVALAAGFVVGRGAGLLNAVDTLGSIAVAIGGAAFLWLGLGVVRRRLLWRVRRKLIISYIFIGVIPALLIVAFFLLGGFLLFSNLSAYLVRNRLADMGERALAIAETTALEVRLADGRDVSGILARRQRALARETPGASIVLIPMTADCGDYAARRGAARALRSAALTAGPWPHLDPPREVPDWIGCDGYQGLVPFRIPRAGTGGTEAEPGVGLAVRAVALPQGVSSGYAAVIDLPVDDAVQARLKADISVELTGIYVMQGADRIPEGRMPPEGPSRSAEPSGGIPQPAVSFLEHRDWTSGERGTLRAAMQLSTGQLYARLVDAQGSFAGTNLGQWFLIGLLIVGVLFLLIQAAALTAGLALARSITGSVHELFAGTVRVQHGDFATRIPVTAPDQLGALAESFNSMTASIGGLLLEAAEKKRLEEELRIAHEIQMSLLPQAPASIPGLSVTALCVPAREVGGDYYDFLPLADDRLGLLIADVSGKGTSAALYMAELKGLMLSLSQSHASPRSLLIAANRLLAAHLDTRSFVTMIYAVIDWRQRTLTYARAGHTPLLYRPGGEGPGRREPVQVLVPDGLVLGLKVDDGALFDRLLEEQTLPLRPGDLFLFYTDGVSEAMNRDAECFGESRLSRFMEEHAHLPCAELRERMLREVEAFVNGAPQHDDMTFILLKVDAGLEGTTDAPAAARADDHEVVRS